MRLDRFTAKFQQALADAQSLAVGRDNQFIEPIHILSALIAQEDGSVRPLLTLAGSDPKAVSLLINEAIEKLPQVSGVVRAKEQRCLYFIRALRSCRF